MAMTMDANHVGLVTKDRTSKFQDAFIEKPGREFGAKLISWLNEGSTNIDQEIKGKMVEIGNTLKSIAEDGTQFFSNPEIESIRSMLKKLTDQKPEDKLASVNKILEEQKKILKARTKLGSVFFFSWDKNSC
jgi:hypothetical protein